MASADAALAVLLDKSPTGSPCNRCGLCCIVQPCGLAQQLLDVHEGRCPALEHMDGQFRCGLVANPSVHLGTKDFADKALGDLFGGLLAVGKGCDSYVEGYDPPSKRRLPPLVHADFDLPG